MGASAERVLAVRGDSERLRRVVEHSWIPMVVVDDTRAFVEVNRPARLVLRASHAQLRRLRIDDITPRSQFAAMEDAWARLMETGCVAGPYVLVSPDGSRLSISVFALAGAVPERQVIAFVPADWPERELVEDDDADLDSPSGLTARELELLQLAADGRSAPMIAEELYLSTGTVHTHFAHVYAKLGVRDRAAAVARAMRLGLIA